MRTKTLLLSAAVGAAGLLAADAQVYSVNSVGYVNLTVPVGFSMIANPLKTGGNTVAEVLNVPDGTVLFKYNTTTSAFDDNTYLFGAWTNPSMTLAPGEGVFINNGSGAPLVITFVGEVMQGSLSNPLPLGFSLKASQVPQAGQLDTVLGFPAADGDVVFRFDNASNAYKESTFLFGGWTGSGGVPSLNVAESFFVNKAAAGSWNRTFSVNN